MHSCHEHGQSEHFIRPQRGHSWVLPKSSRLKPEEDKIRGARACLGHVSQPLNAGRSWGDALKNNAANIMKEDEPRLKCRNDRRGLGILKWALEGPG